MLTPLHRLIVLQVLENRGRCKTRYSARKVSVCRADQLASANQIRLEVVALLRMTSKPFQQKRLHDKCAIHFRKIPPGLAPFPEKHPRFCR